MCVCVCVCVCVLVHHRGVSISSQPVYWTELVILDADSVLVYLLLQLLCIVSVQVSVFVLGGVGRRELFRSSMDICPQL